MSLPQELDFSAPLIESKDEAISAEMVTPENVERFLPRIIPDMERCIEKNTHRLSNGKIQAPNFSVP